MTEVGYFTVPRTIWSDPDFESEPFSEVQAWCWMRSAAVWKPHRVRAGNASVKLDRGELTYSLRYLAEAWRWQKDRVRRFLTRLEKRDRIATRSATGDEKGQRIITICDYDAFRAEPEAQEGAPATAGKPNARQQRDSSATNKNNDKKGKKYNNPSASASAMPVGWDKEFFNEVRRVANAPARARWSDGDVHRWVERWTHEFGLTKPEILSIIEQKAAAKKVAGSQIGSLDYLDHAMEELAERKRGWNPRTRSGESRSRWQETEGEGDTYVRRFHKIREQ